MNAENAALFEPRLRHIKSWLVLKDTLLLGLMTRIKFEQLNYLRVIIKSGTCSSKKTQVLNEINQETLSIIRFML